MSGEPFVEQRNTLVAPSLLASDLANLAEEANRMIRAGADWLHIDIMDGHFVPNITFGPSVVKCLKKNLRGYIYLDCHLMVTNPVAWVDDFAKAGADQYTFHYEALESDEEVIALAKRIKSLGMHVGLALKPATSIEKALVILESGLVDTLLVMTVEPGFGGQSFMEGMMPKVSKARSLYPNINLQVDGGLNKETSKISRRNGANIIVAGTSVFSATNPAKVIAELRADL